MKRKAIRYLGWGLLYASKPFNRIGDKLWRMHRTVLNWNK